MEVSRRITAFLVHREIIPADEEAEKIYEYGLE